MSSTCLQVALDRRDYHRPVVLAFDVQGIGISEAVSRRKTYRIVSIPTFVEMMRGCVDEHAYIVLHADEGFAYFDFDKIPPEVADPVQWLIRSIAPVTHSQNVFVYESSPGKYHMHLSITMSKDDNRRLAVKLGADPAVYDRNRLLRLPGQSKVGTGHVKRAVHGSAPWTVIRHDVRLPPMEIACPEPPGAITQPSKIARPETQASDVSAASTMCPVLSQVGIPVLHSHACPRLHRSPISPLYIHAYCFRCQKGRLWLKSILSAMYATNGFPVPAIMTSAPVDGAMK
jgi:hypothetical protein